MKLRVTPAITSFDAAASVLVRRVPNSASRTMMIITTLGEPIVGLTILALIGVAALPAGRIQPAATIIALLTSAGALRLLKSVIHRTRPDTVYVSTQHPSGYSFPSGHASTAMLAFGFLAVQALRYLTVPWGVVAATFCGLWILLIGFSRAWLGAHFPSDVVGGWALAALLLALVLLLTPPTIS